jgi:ectoine hydroxylase-related dioxygenase (phytanoyl-CoA dioxygenase family)
MTELATAGFRVVPSVLTESDLSGARQAIADTIDRVAHALRTPFESSHPDAPFDERLERIAARDRAYAFALFHAVMADAQRDPRIATLADSPRLASVLKDVLAPATVTGHVVRTRAVVPSLDSQRSPWHQDVLKASDDGRGCGSVRVACWMPLSDVDERSGALELVAGAWGPLPHRNDEGRFSIPDDVLPAGPRSVVPLRQGDVLLLDRFVPHRALPVEPPHARWAIVVWVKAMTDASHS